MYKTLAVTPHPCGLVVTLNRPEIRNAINQTMVEELTQLLNQVRHDEDVRCLLLRGAGGNFCAGGDISDMLKAAQDFDAGNSDAYYELSLRYGQLLVDFARTPCTTIAVLEGSVMGGGLGLAAAADICLAADTARLAMPETSLGLPPAQIAPFVAERIGTAKTKVLALSAQKLTPADALQLGLVDAVAAAGDALDAAIGAHLAQVQRCSPKASRVTKQLLLALSAFGPDQDKHLRAQLHDAAAAFSFAVTQGDGPEGTRAFMEKRQPNWLKPNS